MGADDYHALLDYLEIVTRNRKGLKTKTVKKINQNEECHEGHQIVKIHKGRFRDREKVNWTSALEQSKK
jgi:hypothetical protein